MARGKSLDIVTQAQVVTNFPPLKDHLDAITKGLYLAELVDGFGSESQPNLPLYQLALDTLHSIARDPDSDLSLRYFELRLLQASGLMPELYHCVECRNPLQENKHRFSPNVGGVLCLDCSPAEARIRPLSVRALKVLRLFHRGRQAEALGLRLNPSAVPGAENPPRLGRVLLAGEGNPVNFPNGAPTGGLRGWSISSGIRRGLETPVKPLQDRPGLRVTGTHHSVTITRANPRQEVYPCLRRF